MVARDLRLGLRRLVFGVPVDQRVKTRHGSSVSPRTVTVPRCGRHVAGWGGGAWVSLSLANRAREIMMAGLLNRITNFMRSPKGRRVTNRAREMAKDPRNRERARQAAQKLRRKR